MTALSEDSPGALAKNDGWVKIALQRKLRGWKLDGELGTFT